MKVMQAKSGMSPVEIERIHAEITKLMAETSKLNAEAAKMIRERAFYPTVIVVAAMGAGATLAKIFM